MDAILAAKVSLPCRTEIVRQWANLSAKRGVWVQAKENVGRASNHSPIVYHRERLFDNHLYYYPNRKGVEL